MNMYDAIKELDKYVESITDENIKLNHYGKVRTNIEERYIQETERRNNISTSVLNQVFDKFITLKDNLITKEAEQFLKYYKSIYIIPQEKVLDYGWIADIIGINIDNLVEFYQGKSFKLTERNHNKYLQIADYAPYEQYVNIDYIVQVYQKLDISKDKGQSLDNAKILAGIALGLIQCSRFNKRQAGFTDNCILEVADIDEVCKLLDVLNETGLYLHAYSKKTIEKYSDAIWREWWNRTIDIAREFSVETDRLTQLKPSMELALEIIKKIMSLPEEDISILNKNNKLENQLRIFLNSMESNITTTHVINFENLLEENASNEGVHISKIQPGEALIAKSHDIMSKVITQEYMIELLNKVKDIDNLLSQQSLLEKVYGNYDYKYKLLQNPNLSSEQKNTLITDFLMFIGDTELKGLDRKMQKEIKEILDKLDEDSTLTEHNKLLMECVVDLCL